jgi:hypothetical protein
MRAQALMMTRFLPALMLLFFELASPFFAFGAGPTDCGIDEALQAIIADIRTHVEAVTDAKDPSPRVRLVIRRLANLQATAAEKADIWRGLVPSMKRGHSDGWHSLEIRGGDGSYIFSGKIGELLVIRPDGRLYRGNWIRPRGATRHHPPNGWIPDYKSLREIPPSSGP